MEHAAEFEVANVNLVLPCCVEVASNESDCLSNGLQQGNPWPHADSVWSDTPALILIISRFCTSFLQSRTQRPRRQHAFITQQYSLRQHRLRHHCPFFNYYRPI